MTASDLFIDHLVIATKSYGATTQGYRETGFSMWEFPKSPLMHAALVPFADLSYIEIMSFTRFGRAVLKIVRTLGLEGLMLGDYKRNIWGRYRPLMGADVGENMLILGVDDVHSFKAAAEGRGISFGVVTEEKGKRVNDVPTNWTSFTPEKPYLPAISGNSSDRAVRAPQDRQYVTHQNGANALAEVVMAVDDLTAQQADWEAYIGAAPAKSDGAITFTLRDGQTLTIADKTSSDSAVLRRLTEFGPGVARISLACNGTEEALDLDVVKTGQLRVRCMQPSAEA